MSGGLTLSDPSMAVCENTCSGDPSATILPSAISRMRSAISASSSLAWLATTTVSPFSRFSRLRISNTSAVAIGSSCDVGSSSTMMSDDSASAEAIDSRCFWPPDRFAGCLASRPARPTISRAAPTRRSISAVGTLRFSSAKATSSATLVEVIWVSGSSKTMPTWWASRLVGVSMESRSAIWTCPKNSPPKNCGTMPFRARQSVVLPAPVGPMMPMISPRLTDRSMSASACRSPPE